MTKLEDKIWQILKEARTAALATISAGGAPWVRYVTVRAERDFTLSFCTSLASRKATQIAGNPEVHLTCGSLQPPDDSAYLQIAGRAELRADAATRAKHWQEGWKRYFQGPEDPDYVMVLVLPRLIEYTGPGVLAAEVWTKDRA